MTKYNRLKWLQIYLAGPMDEVEDLGKEWREDMSQFLWSMGTGVLNPCDKPTSFAKEDSSTKTKLATLKDKAEIAHRNGNEEKYIDLCDQIHDIMVKIVAIDLRMVDIAHATILFIDKSIHMCGSYNEQTYSCLQRKPVIICCKQGKMGVPNWLWGPCNHNMFFGSWTEVKSYLRYVDSAPYVEHYNRWRFFDFDKVYGRHFGYNL